MSKFCACERGKRKCLIISFRNTISNIAGTMPSAYSNNLSRTVIVSVDTDILGLCFYSC